MKHPTIYDVAERASVSISTVSLALNQPSKVSVGTLAKVMAVVDELGFSPKEQAAFRARKGIGRIGVVAPFVSYPSFAERLNGVLEQVAAQPREVVVFNEESAARSSDLLGSFPATRRLDGLIIMSIPFDDEVAGRLKTKNLPTILLDTTHEGFTSIVTDDSQGGRLAAEAFIGAGHRSLAYIGEQQTSDYYTSQSQLRLEGYQKAIVKAGLSLDPGMVVASAHDLQEARRVATLLLSAPERPTAIFCHTDLLAAGVLAAARDAGLSVPDELSVIGFDDSDLAAALDLTSINQALRASGAMAMRELTRLLEHADSPEATVRMTLDVSLTRRRSA